MSERDPSLHILQHALGLDDYGRGKSYRNHYVTGPSCDGWDLCMAHVEAGRMEKHEPRDMFGGGDNCCFTVTDAGREYVLEHSPTPPRMSPSKQRYLTWLRVADVYPDMTFGEWLKQRRTTNG
jgi:hypothetical protein